MSTALSLHGLTKHFGSSVALDDVTFDVPEGSLFGLVGPNGAGKSTLFSVVAGFLKPTAGRVEVLGLDVSDRQALTGRLSMLPQDAAFQGGIPVVDQLVMFGRLGGRSEEEARSEAAEALELVGLGKVARHNVRALSHGMMKRVALCQAFLGEPELILLDEPTSGLDPESARRMRQLIRDMRRNKTVVLSSHNLTEIQALCDHAAILDQGHLRIAAPMEEITSATFLVRITLGQPLTPEAVADLEALPEVSALTHTDENAFNLQLALEGPDQKDAALKKITQTLIIGHDLVPRSINEGESLETRFLGMTGGTSDGAGGT